MNPAFLDNMSWEMAEVYGAITDQILINLSRYFRYYKPGDKIPRTAFEYQAQMLAQMGKVNRDTIRIIRNGLGDADEALKNTLEQAIIDSVSKSQPELLKGVKAGILAPQGVPIVAPNQMRAFELYYKQSADRLNLVNTVMLESTKSAYQQTISDVVSEIMLSDRVAATYEALDVATGEVVTGVSSWNTALRHATDRLKNRGITGFVDHAGRQWSAESYVAMDIRTTAFNTGRAAVWEQNQNFGNDLYLVSYHNGARPGCYDWQNKVISSLNISRDVADLDGNTVHVYAQSDTTYGQPAGLFGINCKHYPSPFIPGVSLIRGEPQSPEENEKAYRESQEQRRLERKLREEKRDLLIAKEQGASPEELAKLREKARNTSQDIDDFCDQTGRARHRDREAVYTKREFPDKEKYDVAAFEHKQQEEINKYFKDGGAQREFSAGQMEQTKTGATRFYDELGEAPQRPQKEDFGGDYEALDKARAEFRQAKAQYEENVGAWFDRTYGEKTITDEQLAAWKDKHGIKQYGSLEGIDRRALAAYAERFDRLSGDFPQVLEHRKALGLPFEISYEPGKGWAAEASHGMSFGNGFDDLRAFTVRSADVIKTGTTHGENPFLQVFDHEFGHNLFDAMRNEGLDIDLITPQLREMRRNMESDLIRSLKDLPGISEYATTNVDELFAEAFSAWYGGEKTPFASAFGDFLKRWGAVK